MQTDPTAKSPQYLGKYEVLARLDSGGMAEIFLARSQALAGFEKLVVLKRILPHLAAEEEFVSLFLDEAKTTVALSHGNIVQVFDMGRGDDGDYFIAMEYVAGKNLRRFLRRWVEKNRRPVDPALAAWIAGEILRGLDYAHRRTDSAGRPLGIVHRDLSPHNILISYEGEVKVADFGIAKAATKVVHTETGLIRGKASYMSPEQAQADPLDGRSDLFAVGILLYELLTGDPPWTGDQPQKVLRDLTSGAPPAAPSTKRPGISKELDAILLKALARNPDDRFPSADLFLKEIGQWLVKSSLVVGPRDLAAQMQQLFADDLDAERKQIAALPKVMTPPPMLRTGTPAKGTPLPPTTVLGGGDASSRVLTSNEDARPPAIPSWYRWGLVIGVAGLLVGGAFYGRTFFPETAPTPTATAVVIASTPPPTPTPTATPTKTPTPVRSHVAVVVTPVPKATIDISAKPGAGGLVYLDGKPVSKGSTQIYEYDGAKVAWTPVRDLEVTPGKHVLKVINVDFATKAVIASGELAIEVASGADEVFVVKMK